MANDTKIPLFRRFVIQNFPYIEQDFDALTDYQLISKIVEYLNQVITSQNNLVDDMNDLETAFNTLKDYVDHYFDNLDVQEEINQKLDEMATSGQLQELINNYLGYLDGKIAEQNTVIAGISESVDTRINAQNTEISNFKTTVNNQLAEQDGDISTLVSRMDTFSSLTEGSTTGDAELIDGRTSFDGRTFSNIGDNIRNYQNIGYNDITANLVKVSGSYMKKSADAQTASSFEYYTLPTDIDKYYLIDTISDTLAPQVVMGWNLTIPDYNSVVSGTYNKPIIIKGTGGNVYINNKTSNTHFYVGELTQNLTANEISKYFNDITATATKVTGKYRNKNGSEATLGVCNYYSITPKIGKIYRVFTNVSTNIPVAVQRNVFCYPTDVTTIPDHNVPTYYDIFCTSTDTMYFNEIVRQMLGKDAKIYESIFTYTTTLQQDIKADVGAFSKAIFIGDSLTYGQTYTATNSSYRNFYNYPYYLKKLLQIDEIVEIARSGATAESWWTSYNDQINQNNCTYFIWLGTNDVYTDTVDTDCAGSDYTQFAQTATGYLGRIVGKVASMTNAKIVLLNNFATVGTKNINNKVISDLATKYGGIVIDIDTANVGDTGYHTAYNGYYNSVHFNSQGHNYVANLVANDLMTYMNNHKGEFETYKVHA